MTDVISLFEQQVNSNPQATAVVFHNTRLSYRQLNHLANKLAHGLLAENIGREAVVGLLLPRSIEWLVAMLGTLKAGAAFLPMDGNAPSNRLDFTLQNTSAAAVLTQAGFAENYTPPVDTVIDIDSVLNGNSDISDQNPEHNASSQDLAYVIHTSGSTGNPKGVMIERGNLNSFLPAIQTHLQLSPQDRLMAVAATSFDVHVVEFLLPLIYGATLVLTSDEQRLSVPQLMRLVDEHGVTIMQATPTYWQMMLNARWSPKQAMRLFCGGEALSETLKDELLALDKVEQLLNMYGPTEATIASTGMAMKCGESVLIGRPLANTRVYILDRRMRPVPFGVVGELYLGGQGIARGYINNPSLTEQQFIASPFDNSERLYATGDLVRYIKGRGIEYLGRIDEQIKRHGVRIEPAEIEEALGRYDGVEQVAAVIPTCDKSLLVAYVGVSTAIDRQKLLAQLHQSLPQYMLPDRLITLDSLPVTANGKIDKKQLSALPVTEIDGQPAACPQTDTEIKLAAIFAQLLAGQTAGVDESFFDIGGNSLLVMHLMIAINNAFDVELTIGEIFKSPTIETLATVIERQGPERAHTIEKVGLTCLPASLEMQFMWHSGKDKHPAAYNSLAAIAVTGPLNVSALESALRHIVKRHEIFRTRLGVDDGRFTQQVLPFDSTNKVLGHLVMDDNASAKTWLEQAALMPFELVGGQLFRFNLLKLGADESILAIDLHHIIADGWSMANFFSELSDGYNLLVNGGSLPDQGAVLQYSDYSHWQRERFQGEYLQSQLAFWLDYLKGNPQRLNLPVDRPYVKDLPCDGAGVAAPLDNTLFVRANDVCKQRRLTPFMFYLAVFNLMLREMTGQSDLVVGIPVANRKIKGLDKAMGLFSNAIVLRNDLSANPHFSDFAEQVKRNALEAFAHDGLPMLLLEQALQDANPGQDLPIFRVLFVFQNNTGEAPQLENLTLKPLPAKTRFSKRDFSFVLNESADGINLYVEYNAYLFEHKTMEAMCQRFTRLVEVVLDNLDTPIDELGRIGG